MGYGKTIGELIIEIIEAEKKKDSNKREDKQ